MDAGLVNIHVFVLVSVTRFPAVPSMSPSVYAVNTKVIPAVNVYVFAAVNLIRAKVMLSAKVAPCWNVIYGNALPLHVTVDAAVTVKVALVVVNVQPATVVMLPPIDTVEDVSVSVDVPLTTSAPPSVSALVAVVYVPAVRVSAPLAAVVSVPDCVTVFPLAFIVRLYKDFPFSVTVEVLVMFTVEVPGSTVILGVFTKRKFPEQFIIILFIVMTQELVPDPASALLPKEEHVRTVPVPYVTVVIPVAPII
jgi:hypothetical protein